jgi:hypothetical protein
LNHRTLNLDKLIRSVASDDLRRFLGPLAHDDHVTELALFNPDAFERFFDEPHAAPHKAAAFENLHRINDLADPNINFLIRAYERFHIPFVTAVLEQLSMRLYLDHRDAFESAWNHYVLFHTSGTLSGHRFPPAITRVGPAEVEAFTRSAQDFFTVQAKGRGIRVRQSESEEGHILLIHHGTYLHTLSNWVDEEIAFTELRPVKEDILLYDPDRGVLYIRAGLVKDRDAYLRFFARHMAGDELLAATTAREPLYSLTPVRLGTFNYRGDGDRVIRVDLTQVQMRLPGQTGALLQVHSDDVNRTLAQEMPGISLASGELLKARFVFHIWPRATTRTREVSVAVHPPEKTFIRQQPYAAMIEHYLEAQGVRLP